MKTKIFKSLMPFAVLMFAVVAAFATQVETDATLMDGYLKTDNPLQPCEDTPMVCSTDNFTTICTYQNEPVFGLIEVSGQTRCDIPLYIPVP